MRGRTSYRFRNAVAGVTSAVALVAGIAVVALPDHEQSSSDIQVQLTQNGQESLVVGQKVDLDLKEVVEARIGQKVPEGTVLKLTGLPPGLTQDDWRITGTPRESGLFNVKVEVTAGGQTSTQNVQLMVAAPSGQRPGGVVTSPQESQPTESNETNTTTSNPVAPTTSSPVQNESEVSPSVPESGDTTTSTAPSGTQTSPVVGTPTTVPTSQSGAPETSGSPTEDPACDTRGIAQGIESLLPLVMGEDADQGTATLIASMLGTLLPTLLGTASADNDMLCGDGPTDSIIDGANSLGQLGNGGLLSSQGMTPTMTNDGTTATPGPDLQSLLQMVELAGGILNQVSGR